MNQLRVQCPNCDHVFVPEFNAAIQQIETLKKTDADSMLLWGRLSQRERLVLALIAEGRCNKEVAERIGWQNVQLAKNCVKRLFDKMGIDSRTAAALFVSDHPLLRRMLAEELEKFEAARGAGEVRA